MKFATMYSNHISPDSCPGDPVMIDYQLRIIDGKEEVVEVGKTDWYAYIQSHKDSVDINKILERCYLMEDFSPLVRMPATFMDVTDMPKTLAEAHQMIRDAENMFDRMPKEIKEKYNNSAIEFIADIGSEKFGKNVSEYLDSIKSKETVIKEESKE